MNDSLTLVLKEKLDGLTTGDPDLLGLEGVVPLFCSQGVRKFNPCQLPAAVFTLVKEEGVMRRSLRVAVIAALICMLPGVALSQRDELWQIGPSLWLLGSKGIDLDDLQKYLVKRGVSPRVLGENMAYVYSRLAEYAPTIRQSDSVLLFNVAEESLKVLQDLPAEQQFLLPFGIIQLSSYKPPFAWLRRETDGRVRGVVIVKSALDARRFIQVMAERKVPSEVPWTLGPEDHVFVATPISFKDWAKLVSLHAEPVSRLRMRILGGDRGCVSGVEGGTKVFAHVGRKSEITGGFERTVYVFAKGDERTFVCAVLPDSAKAKDLFRRFAALHYLDHPGFVDRVVAESRDVIRGVTEHVSQLDGTWRFFGKITESQGKKAHGSWEYVFSMDRGIYELRMTVEVSP